MVTYLKAVAKENEHIVSDLEQAGIGRMLGSVRPQGQTTQVHAGTEGSESLRGCGGRVPVQGQGQNRRGHVAFERTGTRGVRQRCHRSRRRQMHLDVQEDQGPRSRRKNHVQGDERSFTIKYVLASF